MRPGGGRAKGASGERELAALLIEWADSLGMALEVKRNLEQVRGGGHDLVGLECYGMAVEVKRVEALALVNWWDQAVRQAKQAGGLIPVLAWRQNRKPWRFRIRAWVYPCPRPLDIDLDLGQFRLWFVHQLTEQANERTADSSAGGGSGQRPAPPPPPPNVVRAQARD